MGSAPVTLIACPTRPLVHCLGAVRLPLRPRSPAQHRRRTASDAGRCRHSAWNRTAAARRRRACRRSGIWPSPIWPSRLMFLPPAWAQYGAGHRERQSSAGVDPAEMDRIALAAEERDRLVKRQADDVGIGADELDQKAAGNALRCIAAGLAAPFAGGEIGFDVSLRQPFEAHA